MGKRRTILLALLAQEFFCGIYVASAGTGFIRVSDGHFVDEECSDFVATGLNT